MVREHDNKCQICGEDLIFYDRVFRLVRKPFGKKEIIKIDRVRCPSCHKIHRKLPSNLIPYKHYEKWIICGVIDGTITSYLLPFEDYPCNLTMQTWKKNAQKMHIL